ncbi:HEAT repeat-containing protein 4 [Anabas testudineus]|uniref:Uncharacterized protein n=1 Tax=Anabas testudineus TaxID=64144 RepID=A0AAQ6IQZ6_ANATE|nr:HEAT repeat-containing protein 4 [Anabas testudineus]
MDSPGRSSSVSSSVSTQRPHRVYRRFLTDSAATLRFSPELGVHSFSQADFSQVFRPTGVLKPAARRRLYGPAPKLQHRELPPLVESSVDHSPPHRRTQMKEVQPVHKAAPKKLLLLNDSRHHRNLQRWSPSVLDTMTPHTSNKSVTTVTLIKDQNQVLITQPQSGPDILSWTAAHCLDLEADCRGVIERLLEELFLCQDEELPSSEIQSPDFQLVVSLLIFLSKQTTLVRSLLAEHLNSPEQESRLLTCNTLSSLHGPINKDVVHKLIHLMWNDQSDEVRFAAAEALIKMGKAQDVQNQLSWKLEGELGLQGKMRALDLISSLKLMTVKLLESFGSCFIDEFTSVRKQACVTAASLQLTDDMVASRVLELMETDVAQEVRLSALTAVAALGLSSADVQETLLRCVEMEEDADLRLAVCQLLRDVGVPKTRLQDFLLQRVDAESSSLVRRMMKEILHQCDFSLNKKHCSSHSSSLQVKHHREWRIITEKVFLLEKLQEERHQRRHLQPSTLARLLSRHCSTDSDEVTDEH